MTPSIPVSEAAELKPCPFCGGKSELVTNAPERWVHCLKCKASGNTFTHESTAVEKWNTRSTAATGSRDREAIARAIFAERSSCALIAKCWSRNVNADRASTAEAIANEIELRGDGYSFQFYAIKPLDWVSEPPYLVARVFRGHYSIERHEHGVDLRGSFISKQCTSVEDAKTIAEADYEARLKDCLADFSPDAILSLNPVGAEALSSLLEPGRSDVQTKSHNEPVGHALSAETKSGDETRTLAPFMADIEVIARALHAVDCHDAARDYQRERIPVPEKWADPWLPTGSKQLDILRKRAAIFLGALPITIWQPIETAPTDGSPILGYSTECVTYVCWNRKGEWVFFQNHRGDRWCFEPTHWAPLPNAPLTPDASACPTDCLVPSCLHPPSLNKPIYKREP